MWKFKYLLPSKLSEEPHHYSHQKKHFFDRIELFKNNHHATRYHHIWINLKINGFIPLWLAMVKSSQVLSGSVEPIDMNRICFQYSMIKHYDHCPDLFLTWVGMVLITTPGVRGTEIYCCCGCGCWMITARWGGTSGDW